MEIQPSGPARKAHPAGAGPKADQEGDSCDDSRGDLNTSEGLQGFPEPPNADGAALVGSGEASTPRQESGDSEGREPSKWLADTSFSAEDTTARADAILGNLSPTNQKSRAADLATLKRSQQVKSLNGRAQIVREFSWRVSIQEKVALRSRSLYMFHADHPLRRACFRLLQSVYFEYAVTLVILSNCVVLALYVPNRPDHILNKIGTYGEMIVIGIFTAEFLLKITALGGFMHEGAYLGCWPKGRLDWWSVMDLIVIVLGLAAFVPSSNNFQVLRTLRLLRPLASVSTSMSMRVLIKSLIGSLARLVGVLMLCSFLYVLYGIIGLEIWMGLFRGHCVNVDTGEVQDLNVVCGECEDGFECRDQEINGTAYLPNPNFGVTSFDNFVHASVIVFQTLFSEGWLQIESYTRATTGPWSVIYWVSLIVVGCFFVVNLAVGVVFASFTRVMEVEQQTMDSKKNGQIASQTDQGSEAAMVGDGGVLARRKWKHPNDAVQPATFTASKTGVAGHNPHQGQSDEEKSGLTSERSEEPAGEASSSEIHAYRRRSVGSDADDGDVVRPLPNLVSSNQLPPIVPRIPLAGNLPGLLPSERTTERAAASNGTRRTARSVLVEIPPRRIQESGGPVAESGEASLNGAHADSASLVWLSRQSPAALAVLKAVDSGYRGQRQNDRGRRAEALLPPYLDSPRPVCEAFPSDSDKCGGQMTDLTAASDSAALLADHNHQPQEEPGTFCCRGGARWNEKLNFVADSMEFQGLIAAIIMANAMTLSLVHYPMAESFSNVLEVCNYVFLSAFAAEAALKIVGLGPRAYFLDAFNVFDFAVILVSLAELAVDNAVSAVDIPGLTVLRALRLLRILKLLKHWSSLSSLAIVVLQGLSNLTSFMVILFIFVFTFALIGMEIFSGRMCAAEGCTDPAVSSRGECSGKFTNQNGREEQRYWECLQYRAEPASYNYDNAWQAFLCTFQVFSGENWHLIMYAAVDGTSMWSCLYFISVVIFGHYLLLNLFLAGIVRNVVDQFGKEKALRRLAETRKNASTSGESEAGPVEVNRRRQSITHFLLGGRRLTGGAKTAGESRLSFSKSPNAPRASFRSMMAGFSAASFSSFKDEAKKSAWVDSSDLSYTSNTNLLGRGYDHEDGRCLFGWCWRTPGLKALIPAGLSQRSSYSLFIFAEESGFRMVCHKTVTHRGFDMAVVVLIVLSSVLLTVQNPWRPVEGTFGKLLNALDYCFTGLFCIEAAMKIVAFNLLWPRTSPLGAAYLRSLWNLLDFLVVSTSLLSLAFQDSPLRVFKAIRTTRAIRPLRILSRSPAMKQVLRSLGRVVAESTSILAIMTLSLLIFAILGVELFSGKFHCCSDPSRIYQEGMSGTWGGDPALECSGNITDPLSGEQVAREWRSDMPNFDNTLQALLTLFQMTTLEDWDAVMQKGVDARGIGICPRRNSSPANALYFLAFILFGALFMSNLVVSAVINKYIRSKDYGGFDVTSMTAEEIEWVDTIKTWLRTRPEKLYLCPKHANWIRKWLFRIVHDGRFEAFMIACVVLNAIAMMSEHWGASETFLTVTNTVVVVFTAIFVLEAVLKLLGMGYLEYFSDRWNQLDFFLAVLSIVTTVVTYLGTQIPGINPSMIRVFRMFRAARVLRAVKRAKGMRMLLRTFQLALPSLWHVGSVLFLVFVVFSILGLYLLGDAEHTGMIDSRINFETFGNSMFVLFTALTGENWPTVMRDLMVQGKWEAIPFFMAFISIAFFVLLNLFLAVILDRFTETKRMEDYQLKQEDFKTFSEHWAVLDPNASLVIPAVKLEGFVLKLPTPLGIKDMGFTRLERLKMLQSLHLKGYGEDDVVHYHEVLFALSFRLAGTKLPPDAEKAVAKLCSRAFPTLLTLPPESSHYKQSISATRIQAMVRGHHARKRLRAARDQVRGPLGREAADQHGSGACGTAQQPP